MTSLARSAGFRFPEDLSLAINSFTMSDTGPCTIHIAPKARRWLTLPSWRTPLRDINMSGMDGLALLGEIKKTRPELPVMMITAYGDEERRRRASEHGAAKFITKPVDFDFLKQQLRQFAAAAGLGESWE
jgi:DNA-binding NtrC family response regulator